MAQTAAGHRNSYQLLRGCAAILYPLGTMRFYSCHTAAYLHFARNPSPSLVPRNPSPSLVPRRSLMTVLGPTCPKMTSTSSSSDLPAPEEDRTVKRPDSGIGESVIRLMTRLPMQHGAVNLSQGFPNEPPPLSVRLALARAVLTGVPGDLTDTASASAACASIENMLKKIQDGDEDEGTTYSTSFDELNQYSPPMGRPSKRPPAPPDCLAALPPLVTPRKAARSFSSRSSLGTGRYVLE